MFDPLVQRYPDRTCPDPDSYWLAVSGSAPEDEGVWKGEGVFDVAIIGGGYTGLSAAITLARDHGINAIVLEARSAAWGCSGRNGSFARISGGRVSLSSLISTYGPQQAKAYFGEMKGALAGVRKLITEGSIECDVQPDGVFKVAVSRAHVANLKKEAALYNDVLGYPASFIPADELLKSHAGSEAHGALYLPDGFSMNPLKLAYGLHRLARRYGAKIFTNSPVTDWSQDGGCHVLTTPEGRIRATKVIVATNGYTSPQLASPIAHKVLPVHSQIIVTAPMTDEQIAHSLPSTDCMFDTRELLFYYRRLPDNRLLFGGRSAITGKEAEQPRHREYLIDGMTKKFPVLRGIKVDHWWGGWVAVTQNSLPFAYEIPSRKGAFYGGGCNGSGVSMSIHIGAKLAGMASEATAADPSSLLSREPRTFPFPMFLRLGQRVAYRWLHAKDRRLEQK